MDINPPLLNSSNPWATSLSDLRELWACPHTGAVTTRTSLLLDTGFGHDANRHRFVLFDPATRRWDDGGVGVSSDRERVGVAGEEGTGASRLNASLNTLGYSYHSLDEYLGFIGTIVADDVAGGGGGGRGGRPKWFIVSVTGTPDEVAECYRRIAGLQGRLLSLSQSSSEGRTIPARLAMEINLSCPNIPGKPPPAYSGEALREYIAAVVASTGAAAVAPGSDAVVVVPWGVKTPPYTFAGQFEQLMSALRPVDSGGMEGEEGKKEGKEEKSPVSFITATNTLGSCLVITPTLATSTETASSPSSSSSSEQIKAQNRQVYNAHTAVLPGAGIGGMAGAPLHPLALGNVATLRKMLDGHPSTRHIGVIGTGGVEDAAGFQRMRDVGAFAVGVGTALGAKGVRVFAEIGGGVDGVRSRERL